MVNGCGWIAGHTSVYLAGPAPVARPHIPEPPLLLYGCTSAHELPHRPPALLPSMFAGTFCEVAFLDKPKGHLLSPTPILARMCALPLCLYCRQSHRTLACDLSFRPALPSRRRRRQSAQGNTTHRFLSPFRFYSSADICGGLLPECVVFIFDLKYEKHFLKTAESSESCPGEQMA